MTTHAINNVLSFLESNPEMRKCSLRVIAQATGVCHATVRKALNLKETNQAINIQKVNPIECFFCQTKNKIVPHHVLPLSWRGPDKSENIIFICSKCHNKIHQYLFKFLLIIKSILPGN